jgi:Leucine-rich repeat (LRR) protein
LKPGSYTVEASKDGKVVSQELVTVTKNGRQVVRVSQEPTPPDVKIARQSAEASAWERSVAAMSRDERLKAVVARLKELNPGFDGKVTPTFEDGVVTRLQFITDDVTDVSPVRALTGLRSLTCRGSSTGKGQLSDLSPLKGMALTFLDCSDSPVSDLSPLKDMKLTALLVDCSRVADLSPLKDMKTLRLLSCFYAKVADLSALKDMKLTNLVLSGSLASDLSPLKGMPLETLDLWNWTGSDLTPLKGMPLKVLNCGGGGESQKLDLTPLAGLPLENLCVNYTQTSDLAPLRGMGLKELHIDNTKVSDLSPLKNMKTLTYLACDGTKVSDLSALQGLPLSRIQCDFKAERDAKILRSIKTLETINGKPAKEFWKEVGGPTKDQ